MGSAMNACVSWLSAMPGATVQWLGPDLAEYRLDCWQVPRHEIDLPGLARRGRLNCTGGPDCRS